MQNLDVLPTIVTAAGGKVDPAWKLDGVDLMPYLTGVKKSRPHETLYWRFGAQWAVRHGDMKLVVSKGGSGEPELYDLAADFAESKNLASTQAVKAKELQTLWDKWSAEQADPSSQENRPQNGKKKATKKNKKATAN